jgi:hypothetical protein
MIVSGSGAPAQSARDEGGAWAAASPPIARRSFDADLVADPGIVDGWVRYREAYGLRSDRAWVLALASNPAALSALNEIGVPLLPREIDSVVSQNRKVQNIVPALETYGKARTGEYAGAFLDGPVAVIQFSDRVSEHRVAIGKLFGGNARIEVRQAPFSLSELEEFARTVEANQGWFTTIGADLYSASVSVLDNKVMVNYIAPDESVEPRILDHFANSPWMDVHWEGPPP